MLRSPVMRDTPLDLNPDPLVIPTLATSDFILGTGTTFAQDYRQYLKFVLDNNQGIDPLDPAVVY